MKCSVPNRRHAGRQVTPEEQGDSRFEEIRVGLTGLEPTKQRSNGCEFSSMKRDVLTARPIAVGFESQSHHGTPGGTRTPNLLIRNQTLYPIELRAHWRKRY